jgi:hypothetical protein
MRALILLLVGLVAGAMLTATAINLLRIGEGPRTHAALMNTLQHQLGNAREAIETGCAEGRGERQFLVMRALADDLEPLFLPRGYEPELFERHSRQFRARLDQAVALPAEASCAAREQALEPVHASCQSCHSDFGKR